MSKQKLVSTISRELQAINEQIDWKIIKGISYKRDARRHKLLLTMLQDVRHVPEHRTGMFSFLH
jgi:hypothetical protein